MWVANNKNSKADIPAESFRQATEFQHGFSEAKNKSWFGYNAALRDLLYDWTIQQQALLALQHVVERAG